MKKNIKTIFKKASLMATAVIFLLLGIKASSEADLNDIGLGEDEMPFA